MKIRIQLTVEVDPDEWTEEYGDERAEVRQRVKDYVAAGVDTHELIEIVEAK